MSEEIEADRDALLDLKPAPCPFCGSEQKSYKDEIYGRDMFDVLHFSQHYPFDCAYICQNTDCWATGPDAGDHVDEATMKELVSSGALQLSTGKHKDDDDDRRAAVYALAVKLWNTRHGDSND